MTTCVLRFTDTSKRYRTAAHDRGVIPIETVAVSDIGLRIAAGSLTVINGPSGSGKSTLLHLAAGMVVPTSGTVEVGDTDVGTATRTQLAHLRRTAVGVVFQQYNLLPTLTALENVTLPLELDGVAFRKARSLAADALERVGIEAPFDRFPDDLSGGQQQRVAIARAVAVPRQVVLADEPTGALDTITGDRIMDLFRGLADDGAAVVVVSHEPRVASFADRVVTLRDGKVVAQS